MAKSKKRKDTAAAEREIVEGRKKQEAIRAMLATLEGNACYVDRAVFEADMMQAAERAGLKIPATIRKAVFTALGERDQEGRNLPGQQGTTGSRQRALATPRTSPCRPARRCPCRWISVPNKPNGRLVEAFRDVIDTYIAREVLPHVPDAWVDYGKTKVGYEIPINRHFHVYKPPRPLDRIEADITKLEGEIAGLLKGLVA